MTATMIQAPKGGHVSPVNGQFYEGGQFMPDHGLFAGLSEKKQLTLINNALAARVAESGRYEKVVREGDNFRYLYRVSCFGAWTAGCARSTLTAMAEVLKLAIG